MPPTVFPYRAAIVRRSLLKNTALIAIGILYFIAAGGRRWHWMDIAMLAFMAVYAVPFLRDLVRITQPTPAVVISDEGVLDPALGKTLIPWRAIKEIRIARVRGIGQLFLMADSERLTTYPGGGLLPIANWLRGARAGRKSADMGLAMTPVLALEATLDDLLRDIRARPSTAAIAIREADGAPART